MTPETAHAALLDVVTKLFENRKRPILGSQLKPAMVTRAKEADFTFDERSLGYSGFLQFVSDTPGVVVRPKGSGLDFLVVPAENATLLEAGQEDATQSGKKIRPDIWKAFTQFERIGFHRVFNKERNAVRYEPKDSVLSTGDVIIPPISKEQQLKWRKEFATSLEEGTKADLLTSLAAPAPLSQFNELVSKDPALFKKWHSSKVQKVVPIIQMWAKLAGIPTELMFQKPSGLPLRRTSVGSPQTREELYSLLDKIPLERLLEIEVPLRWLLGATSIKSEL